MSTLQVDPDGTVPVREQLVTQLRYLIASGHFNVNETLPSTRSLGEQLDVSFHTVRKAYKELEEEGLLSSQVGSGYTVEERTPLAKSERMERGAKVVNDTLQQLVGLGLSDAEIESLFQEQATLLDHAGLERKLIAVGPHDELNRMCAQQLSRALQKTVLPVPLPQIGRHEDADFAFCPYPYLTEVLETLSQTDTMGFATHPPPMSSKQWRGSGNTKPWDWSPATETPSHLSPRPSAPAPHTPGRSSRPPSTREPTTYRDLWRRRTCSSPLPQASGDCGRT